MPLTLPRRPRALLLDAGDTLVFLDTDAVADVLREAGHGISGAALRAAVPAAKRAYQQRMIAGERHEHGWSQLMRSLLAEAGAPAAHVHPLVARLRQAHDALNLWRRVPGDVRDALARARQAGLQVGVISNSEGKLMQLFDHVGLSACFDVVLDSALEGVEKPQPEIFLRALTRLGRAPEEAIYAGDLPDVDVSGARAVGMHGALVDAFGHHVHRDDMPRFASVAELVEALLALPC